VTSATPMDDLSWPYVLFL